MDRNEPPTKGSERFLGVRRDDEKTTRRDLRYDTAQNSSEQCARHKARRERRKTRKAKRRHRVEAGRVAKRKPSSHFHFDVMLLTLHSAWVRAAIYNSKSVSKK